MNESEFMNESVFFDTLLEVLALDLDQVSGRVWIFEEGSGVFSEQSWGGFEQT